MSKPTKNVYFSDFRAEAMKWQKKFFIENPIPFSFFYGSEIYWHYFVERILTHAPRQRNRATSGEDFFNNIMMVGLFDPPSYVLTPEVPKDFLKFLGRIKRAEDMKSPAIIFSKSAPTEALLAEITRLKGEAISLPTHWSNEGSLIVHSIAKSLRIPLEDTAADALWYACSGHLFDIDNQLRRMKLVCGDTPLRAQDIAEYADFIHSENAFLLDKLLLGDQLCEAESHILKLLDNGEDPLPMVGIIARHARQTLSVMHFTQKRYNEQEIARALSMPAFLIKPYMKKGREGNAQRYLGALRSCQKADTLLKTSRIDPRVVLLNIISAFYSSSHS